MDSTIKRIVTLILAIILAISVFTSTDITVSASEPSKLIVYQVDGKEPTLSIATGNQNKGAVALMQQWLMEGGWHTGTIDGIFDPDTKSSLIKFQKAKGLTADGICGPASWKALKTYKRTFDPNRIWFVVVLNDKDGVGLGWREAGMGVWYGHQAILLISSNGAFMYYSFAPTFKSKIPQQGKTGIVTRTTGDVTELKKQISGSMKFGGIYYERFYIRECGAINGKKMYNKAQTWYNNFPVYDVFKFECDNFASQIMGAGNMSYYVYQPPSGGPNNSFDNIVSTWYNKSKLGTHGYYQAIETFRNYVYKYATIDGFR